ncbi:MAG: galactose-1-phosphate uridylyltransferase [Acidobacteria bacterium]|nr:MAG: galactose-1-phosphate uridylyltransferase [Acidobacteriota bacterium]
MSEFRKDPVQNRWVIIDPDYPIDDRGLYTVDLPDDLPALDPDCPFCPGREALVGPELLRYNFIPKDGVDWDIRVVPNRVPVLRVETQIEKEADGIYDWMSGVGADEILIESPYHNDLPHRIQPNRVEQVFWAIHDRILDLRKDTRLNYLFYFKNFGHQAGDVVVHPHSRMIGTPFIPATVEEELLGGEEYFDLKERCVFCDMVKQEMKAGLRMVAENEYFISFCPYASRYPFETWIIPTGHLSHFEASSKNHLYNLAEIYTETFKKLHKVLENVPFAMVMHNGPLQEEDLPYFHWHLEIYPILTCCPGQAMGGQIYTNPVAPEQAAAALRGESE